MPDSLTVHISVCLSVDHYLLHTVCRVFGSYNIVEFSGDPAPERVMLSMARNLLLKVDPRQTVVWNINHQLSLQNLNIES